MANRRRGEVGIELGGEHYTLCFTLGALAELEEAFDAPDLQALAARFAGGRLSGRDLIKLLGVALRGGGHEIADAEIATLPLERGVEPVVQALTECLLVTFGAGENPPLPQDA
jgi:hypothetical protein